MNRYSPLILIAFCSVARADMPPTDTDLHVAYCIAESRYEITVYQTAITESGNNADAISKLKPSLEAAQAALRRFQLYLMPRLPYLDATGLLGAQRAAEADIERAIQSPPDLLVIQAKFKACRDTTTWLPF